MRVLVAAAAMLPAFALGVVHYGVSVDVAKKAIEVTIRIDRPSETESFLIPGWTPGFYTMEQFQKGISGVTSHASDGTKLAVSHPHDHEWTVEDPQRLPFTLSYAVAGSDVGLGFFGTYVEDPEAYINGPSAYMYDPARRSEPVTMSIRSPTSWDVATAMPRDADGTYSADDYDQMADYSLQMGQLTRKEFKVDGVPFEAVFVAPPKHDVIMDIDNQTATLAKIAKPAIDLFHGAPFKKYIFFFHLTPEGFQGGLEHRSGTVIAIPNSPNQDLSDLCAHEFFHAWNVKQIRPVLLGPFDYTKPQRTGNLWFAEGVTDYYSKVLTYRSGVHDAAWLLGEFSDQVNNYQSGSTRLKSTVEDASRASWDNGGFNLGDLDYYNKGLLSGFLLDAAIRSTTHGAKSLDDVMRYMYAKYRFPNPGYPEDGIMDAVNAVAGTDLSLLYKKLIRSTDEMPYDVASKIGFNVVAPNTLFHTALGWPVPFEHVSTNYLSANGIEAGDEFIGMSPTNSDSTARMVVSRNGELKELFVQINSLRLPSYEVVVNPSPDEEQAKLLKQYLERPRPSHEPAQARLSR